MPEAAKFPQLGVLAASEKFYFFRLMARGSKNRETKAY